LLLRNTILAGNTLGNPIGVLPPKGPDCFGTVVSLGNNVIGDPTDCNVDMQRTDLTGDPGLASLVDSGAPGTARYPVLDNSPVIDAGGNDGCPRTDQLNTPRRGKCDIGAIEFYPVLNDLVNLSNVSTDFDPTPSFSAPAGTFHITAEFTDSGGQPILHPFTEVVELTGENLLLNADAGPGGVGARVMFSDPNTPIPLHQSRTLEFVIGLQSTAPFTFLVNVFGDSPGPDELN
jgi:hypothetical protein